MTKDELDRSLNVKNERLRDVTSVLMRLVKAVEEEDDLLSNSGAVWDAYSHARVILGDPVIDFPGGYEDAHFHRYGWTEADGCDTCDDYRSTAAPTAPPGGQEGG